jgi:hypothetical protein
MLPLPLFFVLLALIFFGFGCGARNAQTGELNARAKAARSAGIMEMNSMERARLFAALSGAVYCGDDAACSVQDRYDRNIRFFARHYNLQGWKMTLATARDIDKDVEGFVFFHDDYDDVIVAFRGSEVNEEPGAFQDWVRTNANIFPKYFAGRHVQGNVHQGFLEAMHGIWHPNESGLIRIFNDHGLWNRRIWLTGHSMGGALAALIGMRLADEEQPVAGIYTYGAPKLGKSDFQWGYNQILSRITFQFINPHDPVPRLPFNLVSVGQTLQLEAHQAVLQGRDGAPAWDPLSVILFGKPMEHEMDSLGGLSYMDQLKKLAD